MFRLWQLRSRRWRIERTSRKARQGSIRSGASRESILQLENEAAWALRDLETEIDREVGWRLIDKARTLDVETPPLKEAEMWIVDDASSRVWLSPKGRAHVRRLIDEEKSRRFDVRTRWVTKIVLPVTVALVGLIGALTGLVAVLQHRK